MIFILSSLLVSIIGLVIYCIATTSNPKEIGRLMFFAGMLVFLLHADTLARL